MRIIQVHNRKRQGGGDSVAFTRTVEILRRHGREVISWQVQTPETFTGLTGKAGLFLRSIYNPRAAAELDKILEGGEKQLLHVHNIYPLLSVSLLQRSRKRRIPVVLHCHNYRLSCPTELHFFRNGPCRKCRDKGLWMCVLKNCRGRLTESAAYALQSLAADIAGIRSRIVDRYIVPSGFLRDWLLEIGIPGEKIALLPYPVSCRKSATGPGDKKYIAFAGRISPEKGLETLLAANRIAGLPLQVAGDCSPQVSAGNVTWRGFLSGDQLDSFYRFARFAVVPSLSFETFCLVAAEAMANGVPVIASAIGALGELVEDGRTGLHFTPGDSGELAEKMLYLWQRPELCRALGEAAREKIARISDPDVYYEGLMQIYRDLLKEN